MHCKCTRRWKTTTTTKYTQRTYSSSLNCFDFCWWLLPNNWMPCFSLVFLHWLIYIIIIIMFFGKCRKIVWYNSWTMNVSFFFSPLFLFVCEGQLKKPFWHTIRFCLGGHRSQGLKLLCKNNIHDLRLSTIFKFNTKNENLRGKSSLISYPSECLNYFGSTIKKTHTQPTKWTISTNKNLNWNDWKLQWKTDRSSLLKKRERESVCGSNENIKNTKENTKIIIRNRLEWQVFALLGKAIGKSYA